jgi:nitroimidazol reductase NimA-like FMN-containing flavoprotein (pyridoxamine 5'-phosphate oxidase superfamily)
MPDPTAEILKELLDTQRLGVLATHCEGQPYGSVVAIAATPDLGQIFFATRRATRKYSNLAADSRGALVIDSRSNTTADFHDAVATTAVGQTRELQGDERQDGVQSLLGKHPHLCEFVNSPDCAIFALAVKTYYVVTNFQHVVEYHIS